MWTRERGQGAVTGTALGTAATPTRGATCPDSAALLTLGPRSRVVPNRGPAPTARPSSAGAADAAATPHTLGDDLMHHDRRIARWKAGPDYPMPPRGLIAAVLLVLGMVIAFPAVLHRPA